MREFDNDPNISQTVELMNSYGLDLHGYTIEEIISHWLNTYHANWIRLAIIEALYLGRYKAISVEQILSVWARVGNPNPHFSHEFERLICRKLPRNSTELPDNTSVTSSLEEKILEEKIAALGKNKSIASESFPLQAQTQIDNNTENSHKDTTKSAPESIDSTPSNLERPQQKNRSRPSPEKPPIHEFTPLPDVSAFYNKLKSLAEEKLEEE
ncbi:MAG: hypothetical protein QNJ41_02135 [Xenococcaceae cyanobacterium MO_188.B32]|nr:hypothetical protein [Xenococcaceae cyanobacterium MO_188.B32]